jgi:hypothetical protein
MYRLVQKDMASTKLKVALGNALHEAASSYRVYSTKQT